ncbi:MAG: hypothetical protein BJ554DRAFT_3533 [Olpidium bornovanus]|uniref:Uncharacterized protein n=1 Tax=Olpidium bornovanus TaxID=278681 RepID=A0A8H8A0M7_9FUNG|nr:MAG: hypothetical protein BJ554DRAFT_3533 [Olpidium bornovanus]
MRLPRVDWGQQKKTPPLGACSPSSATSLPKSYRNLLDRWQLFHQRARFDVARRRYLAASGAPPSATMAPPPQVYVRCNFCNQSVAHSSASNPGTGLKGRDGPCRRSAMAGSSGVPSTAANASAAGGPRHKIRGSAGARRAGTAGTCPICWTGSPSTRHARSPTVTVRVVRCEPSWRIMGPAAVIPV